MYLSDLTKISSFVICLNKIEELFTTKAKPKMKLLAAVLSLSLFTTICAVNPYDPGTCEERKRGKFAVVKDRKDDDMVLVCVHRHGKFQWEILNGGHSYGNYFDPAKDCLAVVDNVPDAKSEIYFIQTRNGPIKAWCDVETDNGGFLLIGVKDTPETWAIPSSLSPVYPKGPVRWSSAFGDKAVLDFRVQISTSKEFHDTRAHWYYRFNSPRVLSNLLMSNKGGCSHQYPGVGNIAFVKDLMTRNIATKNFNCSRFGAAFGRGLGWDKMNRCLNDACPAGFAYLHNYQIDTSGSYSYSVKSGRSGIMDKQTSFIGCDHGKCCACFGPDSKQDYCAPICRPINGGTVLTERDNITVWFWIRSSLPKRVWRKCTEFKEKNDAGKMDAWRVEDGIKRKGPCSLPEDITINDGVAVVANNESMNKLPKVEGFLSYLLDRGKLYLKKKSKWEALATQRDVKNAILNLSEAFKQEMENMLSNVDSESKKRNKNVTVNFENFKKEINNRLSRVDRKRERKIDDVTVNLEVFKLEIINRFRMIDEVVNSLTHESCKQISMSPSNHGSGVYQISVGKNKVIRAYCQMSSISGCSDGGWTLVMKIDGDSNTFRYNSSYWTNKVTLYDNIYGRNGGLDSHQYKGSTYWRTSFKEICVGMRHNGGFRAFSFWCPAASLYNLIADGTYRKTYLGRDKWRSLFSQPSLQNNCNMEGFNVHRNSWNARVRLGIVANQENDCDSPNSFIGLGGQDDSPCGFHHSGNSAGNLAQCDADNGNLNVVAMAYILVR